MAAELSLEDQVIVALRRITRAIDLHSRGLLQEFGLTAPQLAALQAIGRLQPVSVGTLAKSIHLSQATLTGILSRLESRSLVIRSRSGSDRRSVVVELTDEGGQLLASAPSLLHDRFRQELLKLKEWEQTQMLSTLQRIAAMMDAEHIEAAPVLSPVVSVDTAEDVSLFLKQVVGAAASAPTGLPTAEAAPTEVLSFDDAAGSAVSG